MPSAAKAGLERIDGGTVETVPYKDLVRRGGREKNPTRRHGVWALGVPQRLKPGCGLMGARLKPRPYKDSVRRGGRGEKPHSQTRRVGTRRPSTAKAGL